MASESYDLAVIGSGPGGYVAAIRAAQLGMRVAVVEEDRPGGVCLNWGCIPSKALLTGAELVETLRSHGETFGVTADGLTLDYAKVVAHSRKTAERLCRGVQSLFKKNQIQLVAGRGRVAGAGVVSVAGDGPDEVRADRVLLATGSTEWVPPGVTVDGARVVTSREAIVQEKRPERVVIVGAGAVGVEFAYVYAMYGSQVTVVEMADQALPGADADVAKALAREFRRKKIDLRVGTRFEKLETADGGVRVVVTHGGEESTLEADQVLMAIGRTALSDDLGLDSVGVETDDKGFVKVDEQLRTRAENVWAIGDLVGGALLAHKASEEGIAAAEWMAGLRRPPLEPLHIPGCIYCQPQVAWVGLTEARAREVHGDVRVGTFPFTASGKAQAAAHPAGFAKIVAEPRYGEIVGAHLVGAGATELINEIGLAMTLECTTAEIAGTVHAHPTLSEALHEAALLAEGRGINF
ncbi:MAG: dihydrolipoyl dehydrogenase [Thermoanaerobaculia bacterium]|nr:dihydrolipoyl dehydrogenase [Thermoanaerobaculia bacterium]